MAERFPVTKSRPFFYDTNKIDSLVCYRNCMYEDLGAQFPTIPRLLRGKHHSLILCIETWTNGKSFSTTNPLAVNEGDVLEY